MDYSRMDIPRWMVFTLSLFGLYFRLPNVLADQTPAKIVVPPKDLKVVENSMAIFYCLVSGDPEPEIIWFKNGKPIPQGKRHYSILTVPNGSVLMSDRVNARKDTILITCDVSNGIGEGDSASATLRLYRAGQEPEGFPIITTQPEFRVVETGRSTVMICAATGDPKPKLSWLHEYQPVDLSNSRLTQLPAGSLQISRARPSDGGKYICVAENSLGAEYSFAANVHVRVRKIYPYITDVPPEEITVKYGDPVNLTCVASGNPEPKVFWVGATKPVTAREDVPYGRNSLILVNMKKTGNYTCVAISELGTTKFTTKVVVEDPGVRPAFVTIPHDQVVTAGSSVALDCEATGRPVPDVAWVRDKAKVVTEGEALKGRNTLHLVNVTTSANYSCVAGSALGMISVTASLMVREPDPSMLPTEDINSIRHLDVTEITSDSVSVTWVPPIRPGLKDYIVSWYEEGVALEGVNTNNRSITLLPESFQNMSEVTVTSLEPATKYKINVAVLFKDGTTAYSVVTVTTKGKIPQISGVPQVLSTQQKTICTIHIDLVQFIVQMQPTESRRYFLVVVPTDAPSIESKHISLHNVTTSSSSDSAYITAEFTKLPDKFVLGDGKLYGSYFNRQLQRDKKYRVFLRVYMNDRTAPAATAHSSTGYSAVLSGDRCIDQGGMSKTQPRTITHNGGAVDRSMVLGSLMTILIALIFA